MNGEAYRALAAVLSAASAPDREAYLSQRTDLDRARIDEAISAFESRFSRRRWRSVVDRTMLDELMKRVRSRPVVVPIDTPAPAESAPDALLSDDVALPPKAKQAINAILVARRQDR